MGAGGGSGDPLGDIIDNYQFWKERETTENMDSLSKKDRMSVALRHRSFRVLNYERMQNGGWAFSMIPAIKSCLNKEDQVAALSATLSSTTLTLMFLHQSYDTLALEEGRANW